MYEELFQTPDRPFRATPDVRFYFPFDSMEQTRQTVLRVIRRAEGPAAVMGGVGLGKSLLAQLLADDLADRFDIVRLHAARLCSRRAMLQNILFELQMPYRDLSEGELRLSLMERMESSPDHAADGLVLIVDEAQTLPTKLLEELRLITNFARQGQARARMVLVGSLQLEETLALPEMSSFNQRLAARCFLQPMNRAQTADFVRHQFACAQVDPKQIITRDALENVYVASEGIPRLANQVMDHALILAIANDQYPISASLIQEAWSDLQQLPMSWNQHEPSSSIPVEFGSIDDLDQDFELEPEGADDLDSRMPSSMSWPAPSDLEDFGPITSPASPTHSSPAAAARVVFDASALFAERTQPAPGRATAPAGPTSLPMTQQTVTQHAVSQPVPKSHFETTSPVADKPITARPEPHHTGPTSSSDLPNNAIPYNAMPHNTLQYSMASSAKCQPNLCDETCSPQHSMQHNVASESQRGWSDTNRMSLDQQESDHDMFIFPDEEEGEGCNSETDNMFAAWNPAPSSYTFEIDLPIRPSSVAANEMQDSMNMHAPHAIPMPLARNEEQAVSDPFGQDFDEEFTVDAGDVRRWQDRQRQRQPMPVQATATLQAYQAKPNAQGAGDCCNSMTSCKTACDSAPMSVEQLVVQPKFFEDVAESENENSEYIGMMATGAVDERLQNEIEDLISQLNFSAFSVEMESVEQISPEFLRQAAGANPLTLGDKSADAVAYSMSANMAVQSDEERSFDDDRDLLVIEEEVPASVRHQGVPTAAPTVGTISYPQLFQQLRG